ncbi:MAG TPA: P-loop NTPase fold protein [Candidatus Dormibacteraeota bacterium]|nr:P-loop NTPase fold protein [Candidatus Dormibacteraeota bacterium]
MASGAETKYPRAALDDGRAAAVVTVWESSGGGRLICNATLLSGEMAIAASQPFSHPKANPIVGLHLLSHQGFGSPVGAYVEVVDALGFATLKCQGAGLGLPPDQFTDPRAPYSLESLDIFFFDPDGSELLQATGMQLRNAGARIVIGLDAGRPGPARGVPETTLGAPVFLGAALVGIVIAVEGGTLQVLRMSAIARSSKDPALRELLRRFDPDPETHRVLTKRQESQSRAATSLETPNTTVTPSSADLERVARMASQGEESADGTPSSTGAQGRSTQSLSDEELFARLSLSGRGALARAEGIRRALKKRHVQTEYLIAGLFPSWKGFFGRAGVSAKDLAEIVRREFGTEIPWDAPPLDLRELPPLSKNTREALTQAARNADERGSKSIRSRHLLYGALSVTNSKTVQALTERGVRREDIKKEESEDTERELRDADDLDTELSAAGLRVKPNDSDLFSRLSVSSRAVLGRAEAIRIWGHQDKIHMEQLIAGLFDKEGGPTQRLFESVKIDRSSLVRVIRETVGTGIPAVYQATELTSLPRVSGHVQDALSAAATVAAAPGLIRSRHLLYGALSINECSMIRALTKLGVNKDGIVLDEEADVDEPVSPSPRIAEAGPTPKVDSDLWCTKDQLGYEAYARTIAELITHEDTVAPLTIGIKAPWGAGKTSLMKRVQHLLDGYAELSEQSRTGILQDVLSPQLTLQDMLRELKDSTKPMGLELRAGKEYKLPPRITVWFNAWKYQTSEQVWAGMAHCIISQVTARMRVRDRELFWLRLHARRVNADQVRKRVYEAVAQQLVPLALILLAVCGSVVFIALAIPLLPLRYLVQGLSVLGGLIGLIWKGREKLGEKAAGTVKEVVKEPDYEGKMGYLHLVESDIREVLDLVTEAQVAPSVGPEEMSQQEIGRMGHCAYAVPSLLFRRMVRAVAAGHPAYAIPVLSVCRMVSWGVIGGAEAPNPEERDAALKGRSSTVTRGSMGSSGATYSGAEAPNPEERDAALKGRSSTVTGGTTVTRESMGSSGATYSGAEALSPEEPNAALKGRSSTVTGESTGPGQPAAVPTFAASSKKSPLVVFVDDLDRCAPNKVAEVVEAINLFLCGDYPNCIFVLGMEPGMVAAALEVANKDVIAKAKEMNLVDETAPVGWRFMEKIVQLPITIPPPTKGGKDSYVETLTGVHEWNREIARIAADPEQSSDIKTSDAVRFSVRTDAQGRTQGRLVKARPKIEPSPVDEQDVARYMEQLRGRTLREVEEKSDEVLKAAPVGERRAAVEASKRMYSRAFRDRDPMIASLVRDLAELVDGNPRQIKRYVNVFRFYSTLRHSLRIDGSVPAEELPSDKVLAKFVALSIQWPHAVDCLRAKADGTISRLEFLEMESAKISGDDGKADEQWKKAVSAGGVGQWAQTGAFREFLKRGESLGKSRGHGLW